MRALLGWAACALLLGCGDEPVDDGPYAGHDSAVYGDLNRWACHPELGAEGLCAADLDASAVAADGSVTLDAYAPATAPQVDCFYVYPTVSSDATDYADFDLDAEERFIVVDQAARYGRMCRVFAPAYRQLSVAGLLGADDFSQLDWAPAYADVLDAFKQYIAHHNDGRGVLLVGHSQGSRHLTQLIREEIETTPALSERFVAAHLIGTTVEVPAGEDVGGTFTDTPVCRGADDIGCIVTYASYRATEPPVSETSIFGEAAEEGREAACSSPATLLGRSELDAYFPTEVEGLFSTFVSGTPFADETAHDPLATPFYKLPGMLTGACVDRSGHQYLEVTVTADPADARVDDIVGDFTAGWGLHLVDMHLAMGDLVDLAERQAASFSSR